MAWRAADFLGIAGKKAARNPPMAPTVIPVESCGLRWLDVSYCQGDGYAKTTGPDESALQGYR